eukprot:scaffold57300_cov69-Phaeocystis_antarctica.AAC.7
MSRLVHTSRGQSCKVPVMRTDHCAACARRRGLGKVASARSWSWCRGSFRLRVESDHTRYIIPLSQSDRLLPDTVLVEYRREEPLLLAKGAWQWLSASISVAEAGGND